MNRLFKKSIRRFTAAVFALVITASSVTGAGTGSGSLQEADIKAEAASVKPVILTYKGRSAALFYVYSNDVLNGPNQYGPKGVIKYGNVIKKLGRPSYYRNHKACGKKGIAYYKAGHTAMKFSRWEKNNNNKPCGADIRIRDKNAGLCGITPGMYYTTAKSRLLSYFGSGNFVQTSSKSYVQSSKKSVLNTYVVNGKGFIQVGLGGYMPTVFSVSGNRVTSITFWHS